jgi:hypothetical protein
MFFKYQNNTANKPSFQGCNGTYPSMGEDVSVVTAL